MGSEIENSFFTKQLNRYLAKNDGRMELFCHSSHPSFADFLGNIDCKAIGNIKFFARTDLNPSVNATLSCDILMDNGIITITTHWCAYKAERADELLSTLLVPLHLMNLQSKTFLKTNAEESEQLVPIFSDGKNYEEEEIFSVFSLSQYPLIHANVGYVMSLTIASKVGLKGLSMFDAKKEYYKRNNL